MSKHKSLKDAHQAREAEKYERPIASREFIMEILAERGEPLTRQQLANILELEHPDDLDALSRRLRAMERDGQVIRNRRDGYGLMEKMQLVRGYVIAHPDGFGFLVPDDGSDDLFMSARQMRQLIHNDRLVACISGVDRRGRREGRVVEVLERNTQQVVGRFHSQSGVSFVVPDNKRITHDIVVPPELSGAASDSQIVVVQLVEQPSKHRQPIGKVVEVLGDHMAPGMEIDVSIRAHELPYQWGDDVLNEVQRIPADVPESAKAVREDLRNTALVTIDGADSRDFDDAVYCERNGSGWRLLVAIADVAHYVKPGAPLDGVAIERGNSVYFPGRVIPMLPEQLSNGLCSINPDVDRLCMVCEMQVNSTGQVKSHRFFEGVMRSHARLIYDDVAALLEGDTALRDKYHALVPHLEDLYDLYHQFQKRRAKRGAIEFETTETVIQFGPEKKIDRIVPLVRNDAHKLIEECMIAANICAAEYLEQHEIPTLYRVHESPKQEKLADLRAFLKDLGLTLPGGEKPEAKHYAKVLEEVRGRPDWHLIQTVMLRSLNQAVYSPDNVGHFGLALEHYAHFTSPIRRYPDLLVHRAIKHVLSGKAPESFRYQHVDMVHLGESCSMTERRADDATRDVVDWLKCEFMMDKVGDEFSGIITGVTSFGLFVELEEIYVEGLVHITALRNDYYRFDPVKHSLIGERTHEMYRLADTVQVRVVRVDLDEKRIDFELLEQPGASEKSGAKADRKSGGKSGERSGKKSGRKRSRSRSRKKDTGAVSAEGAASAGREKTDKAASVQNKKSAGKKQAATKITETKKTAKRASRNKGKSNSPVNSSKKKRGRGKS